MATFAAVLATAPLVRAAHSQQLAQEATPIPLEGDTATLSVPPSPPASEQLPVVCAAPALVRDDKAWKTTLDDFAALYGPSSPSISTTPVLVHRQIEYGLEFAPTSQTTFRPNHVEILVNQSAELLDRCLADRCRSSSDPADFEKWLRGSTERIQDSAQLCRRSNAHLAVWCGSR